MVDSHEEIEIVSYEQSEQVLDERKSVDVKRIMQPKTVTYANYAFSKIQYQVLVHIREELSLYVEKNFENLKPRELIRIPLFCSHYAHYKGNPKGFYNELKELVSKKNAISFSWTFDATRHSALYRWMMLDASGNGERIVMPKDGAHFDQTSVLIVNVVRCQDDTDKLLVDINPLLAPFLLYYGKGNGGTEFERDVALSLTSKYSSRMYEYIMDWSTSKSSLTFSFEELRELLHFSGKDKAADIKRRVLDVAKKEIEASGSKVLFDYRMKYDPKYGFVNGTRGKLPANCVEIIVYRKQPEDRKSLVYQRIFVCLKEVADAEVAFKCDSLSRQIVENGQDKLLESKFSYYNKRYVDGKITKEEFKNTMLKIVRDTTGVDLRSDRHKRNSSLFVRRSGLTDGKKDIKSLKELV